MRLAPSVSLRFSRRFGTFLFAIALLAGLSPEASAKFAREELRRVPIDRLLRNLEAKRVGATSPREKALLEARIGRLHSMAYAYKTEEGQTRPDEEAPYYGPVGDHFQFPVQTAGRPEQEASARKHLDEAVKHLEEAVRLDGSVLWPRLGLAWCLDQAGNTSRALALYREVFQSAWKAEKDAQPGMIGDSVAVETARYMQKLLDPQKDAAELADIRGKTRHLYDIFRAMTPIVIPLEPDAAASALMSPRPVEFDLAGIGPRHYAPWPTRSAGWLVYDDGGAGTITSGLQLFGSVSFWMFWNDGYEVLAALDDDHDGWLTGHELRGLAVWQDIDGNGVSDAGEVRPLSSWGIEALSCRHERDAAGRLYSPRGVVFRSGATRPTYDWIVYQVSAEP